MKNIDWPLVIGFPFVLVGVLYALANEAFWAGVITYRNYRYITK